jgi:hypothetical protein
VNLRVRSLLVLVAADDQIGGQLLQNLRGMPAREGQHAEASWKALLTADTNEALGLDQNGFCGTFPQIPRV